ncbi:MAG TPA: CARDB domain-containing protein [Thermodesulfobacteriota bacterium]|nr:CARDB domain-containing protein [Thermodesulfobacteriota bacterium]
MKKRTLLTLLLVLLGSQIQCGGGGVDSSTASATRVEVTVGGTRTASVESRALLMETDQIPSSVSTIRITITAPDMETILRSIPTDGRPSLTEAFQVKPGPNRLFTVEALDSTGTVIYRGETRVDVGALAMALTINMANTDPLAPIFAGLMAVTPSGSSFVLTWNAASDAVTPPSKMQYVVFESTVSGRQNFSAPLATVTGVTSYTASGLSLGSAHYFVVRAMDEHGNMDSNTQERSSGSIDLSIGNVQRGGDGIDLTYTVNNTGTVNAANVTIYALYVYFGGTVCSPETITVPAGGSTTLTTPTISTAYTYKIIADPANAIVESNESNNVNCYDPVDALCLDPTPSSCVAPPT